ncbi:MAG: hypothetical protein AB1576_04790 [Bacillota bacterium]
MARLALGYMPFQKGQRITREYVGHRPGCPDGVAIMGPLRVPGLC